jgi:sodium transport system permease protein
MLSRTVWTIYRKELIDTLRDRRTLIFMLAIPIVAIPLMIMVISQLMMSQIEKQMEYESVVVVQGAEHITDELWTRLNDADRVEVKSEEDYRAGDSTREGELKDELIAGEFEALVVIPETFDSAIVSESRTEVEIYFDEAELRSKFTVDKLDSILKPYGEYIVAQRLASRDVPAEVIEPFDINSHNVAPMRKLAGEKVGAMLPYVVILMCFMGAIYPAIDLAAGEKERGTLETLLVSPASRGEFVVGKYLVILTTSLVAALMSLGSLTFSINYMIKGLPGEIGKMLMLQLDIGTILLVVLVVLPMSGIFAALLLSLSVFARSFKEAQNYSNALTMMIILPAIASMLPGVEMSYKLALIPVLNASLIIKNAVSGTVQWNYVATAFVASIVYAVVLLFFAKKWFERESVLFRT